jgi:hypothetical protein
MNFAALIDEGTRKRRSVLAIAFYYGYLNNSAPISSLKPPPKNETAKLPKTRSAIRKPSLLEFL